MTAEQPIASPSDVPASSSEDLFVGLMQEAAGMEAVCALAREYPFQDIYGAQRFIDYALLGRVHRYAFEVDGEYWHAPDSAAVPTHKLRDDLLRQNSLVHGGWKVYRWTDGELANQPARVIEEIRLFLEEDLRSHSFDGHLPQQEGAFFSLQQHQRDALDYLEALRARGSSVALVTHATGTGKTVTALAHARRLGLRTLYLVNSKPLARQAAAAVQQYWPSISTAVYHGGRSVPDAFVVVATMQAVHRNLISLGEEDFGYLIVDEAHHVPAPTFRQTIGHFRAKFTLGLTATPDRADGESLLKVFVQVAPRLGLKEAIERGLLCPIRCMRVQTNVDLSRVRFNSHEYRLQDLEERLFVPERNTLIVSSYCDHVFGKRGVAFCVNVQHAQELARLFQAAGVPAESVSGRMSRQQQEVVLERYADGDLAMLCACDLLNEGWDSPATEVLLMARPTLSRVLYLQQLGRGTRRYPGKECLYVFDFVDNAGRYAQALSLHKVLGIRSYRPGGLVAATQEALKQEADALGRGEIPEAIAHLGLTVARMEEVDIFDWRLLQRDMLTEGQVEWELGVAPGMVSRAIQAGRLDPPDHTIPIGARTYRYFAKARLDDIRKQLGLPRRTQETRRDDFLRFISEMDMAASYKPVFLVCLLDTVDADGRCSVEEVAARFRAFYIDRAAHGLPPEFGRNRMARVEDLTLDEIRNVVLTMPFEKFERRKFMRHDRDVARVRFDPALWRALRPGDLEEARMMSQSAIEEYYARGR